MSAGQAIAISLRDGGALNASLSLLPKNVLLLGEAAPLTGDAPEPLAGLYEFEVVTGNAAYREGERFYLTQAQAKRAYCLTS